MTDKLTEILASLKNNQPTLVAGGVHYKDAENRSSFQSLPQDFKGRPPVDASGYDIGRLIVNADTSNAQFVSSTAAANVSIYGKNNSVTLLPGANPAKSGGYIFLHGTGNSLTDSTKASGNVYDVKGANHHVHAGKAMTLLCWMTQQKKSRLTRAEVRILFALNDPRVKLGHLHIRLSLRAAKMVQQSSARATKRSPP